MRDADNEVTVKRIVGPTILLYSGRYFDFENPEGSIFDIGDIARGLSHICRFAGQCERFYSVAEHSVHVSRIVPPHLAMAGLMHDAVEAFIGDMAKPLKVMCADYQTVEKRIERVILDRFRIKTPLDPAIKDADIRMLATEQAQIMRNRDDWQHTHGRTAVEGLVISCLPPDDAFNLFIDRFEELTGRYSGIPRLVSIETACREKDAEIARLTAERDRQYDENVSLISENARRITERDQLRAKLDDATRVQDVFAAALDIADRLIERGYGLDTPEEWHKAFRSAANARAAAPQPEPKAQCASCHEADCSGECLG